MDPIKTEVMLLNWSETANGGAKLVLQLADTTDLEHFKQMTLAKGKRAGQRLAAVFVEIGDDERPVEHRKKGAGPLAQLAGRWCEDVAFQHWITETHPDLVDRHGGDAPACVRAICGVASRAELDLNPSAARIFHDEIREPFMAWLQERKES